MFHTIKRTAAAASAFLQVELVFGLLGFIMALAANSWEPMAALLMFSTVFFAPAAWANTWSDFGD